MAHLHENLDFLLFGAVVLVLFAGLHLWLRRKAGSRQGVTGVTWLLVCSVLGVGAVVTDAIGHRERAKLERAVMGFAPTYAQEFERLGHAAITPETAPDHPAYLQMIEAQRRWLSVNPVVNDIYTVRRGGPGEVLLIVDSETDYDRNGRYEGERESRTDIGEALELGGPVVEAAFAGRGGFDEDMVSDRWGTWVSAYWPIHDADGKVEALLGVDYDAGEWAREIRDARWNALAASAVVALMLFGGTVLLALRGIELEMRQQHAEALAQARDAAESASALKSQFLARMSHEIRTPINGVMGVTELLLQTPLDAKQQHFSELIYRSATTLLDVINDILDYSKIEAGKLTLEQIDFDPRDLFEDVAELLAARAQGKGLDLNVSLPVVVGQAVHLRGDPARLRQIVTNLVGNAIKFTASGEVTVVSAWPSDAHGQHRLRCEVRDTGAGVDPSKQAALFEPFVQADNSTTRRFGGTGLGLAICKRLVDAMGGRIGCDARVDGGSLFWFEVPLARAERVHETGSARAPGLRGVKALIVDDNATNREILEHTCEAWGMRYATATDGRTALTLLAAAAAAGEPFDVGVLDLDMPEMDGLELARLIKRDPALAGTQLLMLSSVCHIAGEDVWRDAGIERYLIKPARQNHLFRALTDMLGSGAGELAAQPTPTTLPGQLQRALRGRVLLAEDNAVNQLVAQTVLEGLGLEVLTVGDGRAAVNAVCFGGGAFDIVLMDCEMPELDGRAATTAIRAFEAANGRARLPIVALTAHAMESDRQQCLEAGMDDYLSKPFTGAQLAATLARWLPAPADALPADRSAA